jgi:hypothetical protein
MGNKYNKPDIDLKKIGTNPFLFNLKIDVNKIPVNGAWKRDKEGIMLPMELELERAPFCKVFSDSKRRLEMVKLSPRAKDLLLWVIYEVDVNKDWFWLNRVRYMEESKVSSYNTYKSALDELLGANYLSPMYKQGYYWINPHFLFNGNRPTIFPKNVIK